MSTLLLLSVMSVGLATLVLYVLRLLGARRHGGPAVTSPPVAMATPVVKSTSGFTLSAADNNNRVGDDESRAASLFTVRGVRQAGATDEMAAVAGTVVGLRHRQQRQLIQTVVHHNDCPYDSDHVEKLYTQLLSKVSQRDAAAGATNGASLDLHETAADPLSTTARNCFRSSELEWEKTRRRAAEEWAAFLLSSLDAYVAARNSHEDFHFRLRRRRRISGEDEEAEPERANGGELRRLVEVNGGGSVPTLRRRFQAADDEGGVSGNGGTGVLGRVGRRVDEMRAEPRITSSDSSRRTIELPRHSGRGTDNIMATYSCWLERYHAELRDDPAKFRQTPVHRRLPATADSSTVGRVDDEFEAVAAYNEKILNKPQLVQWPWLVNGKTAVESTTANETKMQKESAKWRRQNEPEVRTGCDRAETAAAGGGGKTGTNWYRQGPERLTGETSATAAKTAGLTESMSPALVKLAERFERPDCCSPRQTTIAQRGGSAKLVSGERGTDDSVTVVDRSVPSTVSANTQDRLGGSTAIRQLLPVQRYLQRQLQKQKKEGNTAESGLEAILLWKSPSTEAVAASPEPPASAVASASVEKPVGNFEPKQPELVAPTGKESGELENLSGTGSVSSDDPRNALDDGPNEELSTDELNEKDMWRQIVLEKCRQTAESDDSMSVLQHVGQQLPALENGLDVENRDTEDTTWKDSVLEEFRVAAMTESEKVIQVPAPANGDEENRTADELEPEEDSVKSPTASSRGEKDENENVANCPENSQHETLLHSAEAEKLTSKIGKPNEEFDYHQQQQQQQLENHGKGWRNVVISEDLSPSSIDVSALRLSVSGEWDEEKVFDEMRNWDVDDDLSGDETDNWNNNNNNNNNCQGRRQHRKCSDNELEVTVDGDEETVETDGGLEFVQKDVVFVSVEELDARKQEADGETVLEKGRGPASVVCNTELAVTESIYSTKEDAEKNCRPADDDDVTDSDQQLFPLEPARETVTNHGQPATCDHQLVPFGTADYTENRVQRYEEPAVAEEFAIDVDADGRDAEKATRMTASVVDDDCEQQLQSECQEEAADAAAAVTVEDSITDPSSESASAVPTDE